MLLPSPTTPAEALRWAPRATACDEDAYGVLRAPTVAPQGLLAYKARDDFSGTAAGGTLNGRTAPVGGAWATSGAAADFVFADPVGPMDSEAVTRSDATAAFRYGVVGPTLAAARVSVRVAPPSFGVFGRLGAVARWVDANNHVRLTLNTLSREIALVKVVGGVATTLASTTATFNSVHSATLELSIDAAGQATATYVDDARTTRTLTATDTDLATGGALASGKGGIADNGDGGSVARYYDSIEVTEPPPSPAVMYANQSAELRTDGMYRDTITGDSSGPVASVIGDLPRLPPSGAEGRPVELFLKPSNGDLDQLPDDGTAELTVQVYYRASWLTVPGS